MTDKRRTKGKKAGDAPEVRTVFRIEGMHCVGCESTIARLLMRMDGVREVKASYPDETVEIILDPASADRSRMAEVLDRAGYRLLGQIGRSMAVAGEKREPHVPLRMGAERAVLPSVLLFLMLAVLLVLANTVGIRFLPEFTSSMGFGLLFVTGLATSIHCVAMCGGICLSQTLPAAGGIRSSLLYNAGRVVSYTIIGGIVGALGSVLQLSGMFRGAIAILAGLFMVVMGLNLLGLAKPLRRFIPRLPARLQLWLGEKRQGNRPFVVGLLNGLMPCGPLQSVQLYALGTGSLLAGAMSMFAFSLGTVPLMFITGLIGGAAGAKFTRGFMKVGAVLVLVLGILMTGRGMALSGIRTLPQDFAIQTGASSVGASAGTASASGDVPGTATESAASNSAVQTVTANMTANQYPSITVKVGVPVRFSLMAEDGVLNGCNRVLVIPAYDKQVKLQKGENVIEFTPDKAGVIPYSCWMGMVTGEIVVEE